MLENLYKDIMDNLDKEYNSYPGRLEKKYDYITCGSGRKVFDMKDNKVLKVSYNVIGDMQGEVEVGIFQEPKGYENYLCPILLSDIEAYNFIVMPKVIPVTELLSRSTHPFVTIVNTFDEIATYIKPSNISNAEEMERIVKSMEKEFGLCIGDLLSIDSWGLLEDKLVIFDYGCNFDVFCALKGVGHEEL